MTQVLSFVTTFNTVTKLNEQEIMRLISNDGLSSDWQMTIEPTASDQRPQHPSDLLVPFTVSECDVTHRKWPFSSSNQMNSAAIYLQ